MRVKYTAHVAQTEDNFIKKYKGKTPLFRHGYAHNNKMDHKDVAYQKEDYTHLA
jgi:hypothetical protein